MNKEEVTRTLSSLVEKCEDCVLEMNVYFQNLEEWKESLKNDVKRLLCKDTKGPVIPKTPAACSRIRTRRLSAIQENDDSEDILSLDQLVTRKNLGEVAESLIIQKTPSEADRTSEQTRNIRRSKRVSKNAKKSKASINRKSVSNKSLIRSTPSIDYDKNPNIDAEERSSASLESQDSSGNPRIRNSKRLKNKRSKSNKGFASVVNVNSLNTVAVESEKRVSEGLVKQDSSTSPRESSKQLKSKQSKRDVGSTSEVGDNNSNIDAVESKEWNPVGIEKQDSTRSLIIRNSKQLKSKQQDTNNEITFIDNDTNSNIDAKERNSESLEAQDPAKSPRIRNSKYIKNKQSETNKSNTSVISVNNLNSVGVESEERNSEELEEQDSSTSPIIGSLKQLKTKQSKRNNGKTPVVDDSSSIDAVESRKRSSKVFVDPLPRKRSHLEDNQGNIIALVVEGNDSNTSPEESRTRSSEGCEDLLTQKKSNLIEEDTMQNANSVINNDQNTSDSEYESVEEECDEVPLNHQVEVSGEEKVKNQLSVNNSGNSRVTRQEYDSGVNASAHILDGNTVQLVNYCEKLRQEACNENKRVTRSKARAIATAGVFASGIKQRKNSNLNRKSTRASIKNALKRHAATNKKHQASKENLMIYAAKKQHCTPLMTSKILTEQNYKHTSTHLLNSSKKTPLSVPLFNVGSATKLMKSALKPNNIVTNVETFIKKPKPVETNDKRQDLKKWEEKEKEAVYRKEEMLRIRAEERKKKMKEQRLKVLQNREAIEKERQEVQKRIDKEKSERLHVLLQEKEEKQKCTVLKKKQEKEKKATDRQKIQEAEAARIAKQKQEELQQKKAMEKVDKETLKQLAEVKEAAVLREQIQQKTEELAQLKHGNAAAEINLNTTWIKPCDLSITWVKPATTAMTDLNTTWVKPATVNSVVTDKINNAYFLDDLLSGDSGTEENTPRKKVARWAKRSRLLAESELQLRLQSKINNFFSYKKLIDIREIFPNKRVVRSSSAKWDTPPRYSCLPKY